MQVAMIPAIEIIGTKRMPKQLLAKLSKSFPKYINLVFGKVFFILSATLFNKSCL